MGSGKHLHAIARRRGDATDRLVARQALREWDARFGVAWLGTRTCLPSGVKVSMSGKAATNRRRAALPAGASVVEDHHSGSRTVEAIF